MPHLVFLTVLLFFLSSPLKAHQGHTHLPTIHSEENHSVIPKSDASVFKKVEESYNQTVRPIFTKKCADCHGGPIRYPWYYSIPGIRQMMDHDIREGAEHLDFSRGYPFKSHATPLEDLEAIRSAIEEGSMPPWKYRVLHPGSGLTEVEKKIVIQWVEDSKALLKK